MMETKTYKAITLLRKGDLKAALAIFSTFRIGFATDEKRTLEIAHECLCGGAAFYRQIGIDAEAEIDKSRRILEAKYLKHDR